MTIQLAEPMLFLQGFYQNDHSDRTPAMLRGSLVLRIAKPTKIKTISLTFRGKARTEWPEGNYNPKHYSDNDRGLTTLKTRHSTKEIGILRGERDNATHVAIL